MNGAQSSACGTSVHKTGDEETEPERIRHSFQRPGIGGGGGGMKSRGQKAEGRREHCSRTGTASPSSQAKREGSGGGKMTGRRGGGEGCAMLRRRGVGGERLACAGGMASLSQGAEVPGVDGGTFPGRDGGLPVPPRALPTSLPKRRCSHPHLPWAPGGGAPRGPSRLPFAG